MAKLIYTSIASLDGYTADEDGKFEWAAPSEEVHAFINDLERPIGTHLYGRRMYETMVYWETARAGVDQPPTAREYAAIWQGAEKIVYSRTLQSTSSSRTRIVRAFEPEAVRRIKEEADADMTVGGPELAGQAIAAGLVDECHLFVVPIVVGAGKHSLPSGVRAQLVLLDLCRFDSGVVHLHYRY
jgi:dihydrofolate reductase